MTSDPKRLTVVGATDLERSLLQAARRERPSPELTARMAAGLGISGGRGASRRRRPAAAAAPVAAAKTTLTAWMAAGVFAAAVARGSWSRRRSLRRPSAHAGAAKPAPAVSASRRGGDRRPAAPAASAAHERRIEKTRQAPGAGAGPGAATICAIEIALIDAARTAVKAGSTERALVLLRRYEVSYPGGAFRPEALALRIEALDEGGRGGGGARARARVPRPLSAEPAVRSGRARGARRSRNRGRRRSG